MADKFPLEGMERLMFSDYFNDKKILVSGNTGFKGSWLTVWLLKLGARVYGVSRDVPTQPAMFEELHLSERVAHTTLDIRDLEGVCGLVADIKPDIVFHLAAQPIVSLSYLEPVETLSSNIMGTTHILEALRRSGHQCSAVIITSDKCYDNVEWVWGYRETDNLGGKDIYSASKGAAELVIKSYFHSFFQNSPVKLTSARAGNVIGGGDWALDRIVPDCMRAWSSKQPVEIRNPNATRPWQHVLEPLSGYLVLAKVLAERPDAAHGESFNFGPRSEYNFSVVQILSDMSRHWEFMCPADSFKTTGITTFAESGLLKLNCDKALHALKWMPTFEYDQMIEAVSSWYYKYYKEDEDMYEYTITQIDQYEAEAQRKGLSWTK